MDRRAAYGAVRAVWLGLPPPVYGRDDCVLWACAVITALTGRDPRPALALPVWHDRRSAVRAIRAFSGGGSLDTALARAAAQLGLRPVDRLMAQAGDLALLRFEVERPDARRTGQLAPGIIDPGRHGAALTRLSDVPGLVSVPMAGVARTWRLGHG